MMTFDTGLLRAVNGADGYGRGTLLVENMPELARLIEAWPALPHTMRTAILTLIGGDPAGATKPTPTLRP